MLPNNKFFTKDGWLSIPEVITLSNNRKCPFVFIVGARGTGKTYGALKYCLENKLKFLYLRRLKTQYDLAKSPMGQPFKAIDNSITTGPLANNLTGFYYTEYDQEKEKDVLIDPPIGYMAALSTFANLRSMDFSDVDIIVYDEFIAQASERVIKDEASALWNLYETVNRNRELQGKAPTRLLCLGNSNELANPIFISLGIVNKLLTSRKKGYDYFTDVSRGLLVIDVTNSPVSLKKAQTALYKLTEGSEFSSMALNNDFVEVDETNVKWQDINEYKPVCAVGEIFIYQHKSNNNLYVTKSGVGNFTTKYSSNDASLKSFAVQIGARLKMIYLFEGERVFFDSYVSKVLFEKYTKV